MANYINFSYFEEFKTNKEIVIQILVKTIFTIFSFLKAFCLLKIIDIFSPQHVSFLNTSFSFYHLLRNRIKSHDDKFITAIDAFFLLIIILGTLIFNEMIILNFFGLNKNTKKYLIIKEQLESKELNESTNEGENNRISINGYNVKLNDIEDKNSEIKESEI